MGKGDHEFYKKLDELHKPVGTYDNGACLVGHLGYYKQRDSCSYRWQGLAKAKQSPGKDIYDSHPDRRCHLDGTGYGWASTEALAQGKGGVVKWRGEKKVFSKTEKQKVRVQNFTTGYAPYANQVHHVLPSAVLRNSIMEVAKRAPIVEELVGSGLLTEKYNINHKDNMIILPVKWRDACKIGLPTHMGSHPAYSEKIQKSTMDAMRPYEKIAEQVAQKKAHDKPAPEDLKDALEGISNRMYAGIIALRPSILGQCSSENMSINELPRAVYACLRM